MQRGKWATRLEQQAPLVTAISVLLAVLPGSALAQDLGARSLGAGMTGRADGSDTGAMGLNISAISFAPRYDVTAGVGFGPDKLFLVRGYAVDSRTSIVTTGAGYYRYTDTTTLSGDDLPGWKTPDDDLANPTEHQGATIAIAYPVLPRHLALGVSGRYDWRDGERSGKESDFNFGMDLAARPLDTLTLSLALRNALLLGYPDTQREIDAGARFDPGPFLGLEVDGVVPLEKDIAWNAARLGVGAQVGIAEIACIRAGWSTEGGSHDLTAGLGFTSDHAAVDYGVRFHLGGPLTTWHSIDLKVMF